jgi:hypothetical protein
MKPLRFFAEMSSWRHNFTSLPITSSAPTFSCRRFQPDQFVPHHVAFRSGPI